MKQVNFFKEAGDVGEQVDDLHWILNAQRKVRRRDENRNWRDEIFTDEVPVWGTKPKDKRVFIAGYLEQKETPNGVRTYLEPWKIRKAKKDEYANAGELIGEFLRWTIQQMLSDKTPFGRQLIRIGKNTLHAILFENVGFRAMSAWDKKLKIEDAAQEGSIIKLKGFLRRQPDVENAILGMVANEADVLYAAPDPFLAMQQEFEAEQEKANGNIPESDNSLAADPIV